jgi:hypothetical protein
MIDVVVQAGSGSNLQLENIIVIQDYTFLLDLEKLVIDVFWKNGMRYFKKSGFMVKILTKIYGVELTESYKVYHKFIKQRKQWD